MATDTSDSGETTNKNRSFKRPYKPSVLIFVLFFAIVGTYFTYNTLAAPSGGNKSRSNLSAPNLTLSPTSKRVSVSSPLVVELWADSAGRNVNAVQANLTYPLDKLNFVNVDTTGSAFGLAVQANGENGKISIARGSFEPISGKLYIAKINFTGAARSGKATVSFAQGRALLSSDTNQDILTATYGGSYSLTQ
jgi:hypothetical protein